MKYYITTRDRQNKQLTLNSFPAEILKDTWLVVPYDETGHNYDQIIQTPPEILTIGDTRQWLIERHVFPDNKIAIFDDDLNWNVRITNSVKLRKLENKEELIPCFRLLEKWLDEIPLVAVSTRQGNNTVITDYADNTRVLRNFFINLDMIEDEKFNRIFPMEDYDFELQLLRNGKPNRVLYTYSQDQPASCIEGGTFSYRNKENQAEAANALAKLHPGLVTVKIKETKAKWFGDGIRTDVIIYWKKAFRSSQSK